MRGAVRLWAVLLTLLGTAGCGLLSRVRHLAPLTTAERDGAIVLRRHVEALAAEPHNVTFYPALRGAAEYIEARFHEAGYAPRRQAYVVSGREVANIEVERVGTMRPERIVVIGAHYDSVGNVPGANDNASGVAALLELARRQNNGPAGANTVRFVAFVNEEPPYFMTDAMGSLAYAARAARRGEQIIGMISLETIGYYSDAPDSQRYPAPFHLFFPRRGNFLAMVSNIDSAPLLRRVAAAFRRATTLPAIASPAPARIPGVGWSDHWSFWQHGYQAIMFTDTAPYRYPHYHTRDDTPDKLDYERLARVVTGCDEVIRVLSGR
jgi:Zn-dependent M28 family amino/carboxypeptidase